MATRVSKRRLTISEAAAQFEQGKREIRRQQALVEEASETLLTHFRKTGNATYKNRIGWRWTGGSVILDQGRIRAFLGEKVGEFQRQTERKMSLVLLGDEGDAR